MGRSCALQIHPYCTGETESVVLAHLPSPWKAMALKSPDWWGVHACHVCHDIIDGRRRVDLPPGEIRDCIQRGLFRTWAQLIEEGVIVVPQQ